MTMQPWMAALLAVVGGYFIGAINPSTIIAKARGIDLQGQGWEPGATNAGRIMGKRTGVVVALLDILKGFVPAALAAWWWGDAYGRWPASPPC